jgi:hypothetical protein
VYQDNISKSEILVGKLERPERIIFLKGVYNVWWVFPFFVQEKQGGDGEGGMISFFLFFFNSTHMLFLLHFAP